MKDLKKFIATTIREYLNEQQSFDGIEINDNFFKWFGDSKVVDKNRNPLLMFHGTSSEYDFDVFDGERGVGWFTPSEEYANGYIRDYGKTLMVFLSIKTPYILKISPQIEMTIDEFVKSTGIKINKKYFGKKYENEKRPVWDWYNPSLTNFLDELEKLGYDGMKTIEYNKYDSWLPFNPNQIKSSTNDGSWDIVDVNINS